MCVMVLQEKVLDVFMNGCNRVVNHVDEVCFVSIPSITRILRSASRANEPLQAL